MTKRRLITFDWALKRLLRSKANFDVLEGFLSELLHEEISILEILESESNKDDKEDKFNRVDLKVKNSKEELLIIEVQYDRQYDFLQRILYGASKAIVEHLQESQIYQDVIKVISVSILYFDLGYGNDYIYRGRTQFTGLHKNDELQLSPKQRALFSKNAVAEIYPEYYLLKINQFDDVAEDTLDEWIYFLKNEEIKDEFQAKGLKKAKEILDVMKLSEQERKDYERYIEELRYQASMFQSHYVDGKEDGRKEGREEGEEIGIKKGEKNTKIMIAENLLDVLTDEQISLKTGLSIEEVERIRKTKG